MYTHIERRYHGTPWPGPSICGNRGGGRISFSLRGSLVFDDTATKITLGNYHTLMASYGP